MVHNPQHRRPKFVRTPMQGQVLDRRNTRTNQRGDARVKSLSKNLTPRAEKCPKIRTSTDDTKSYRRFGTSGCPKNNAFLQYPTPDYVWNLKIPGWSTAPASDGPKTRRMQHMVSPTKEPTFIRDGVVIRILTLYVILLSMDRISLYHNIFRRFIVRT